MLSAEGLAGTRSGVTRDDVVRAARSWLGTPYHHQSACKGVGADCLGLVRGVYQAICGREGEQAPAYSADWGEVAGQETLLEAARRNLVERDMRDVRPGDVVVFRMRRGAIAKHTGVVTSPTSMVHAVERIGVVEVNLGFWWQRRLVGVFAFPGIED